MRSGVILAIDQGTTNTKALLVNSEGRPVFRTSMPVELLQPQLGLLEQDPRALWKSVCGVIRHCTDHARDIGANVEGIAISNQRETALMWWRAKPGPEQAGAGKPLVNAISWQCQRSAAICDGLNAHAALIRQKTGLPLGPLATAGKWSWVFEKEPGLKNSASEGEICLGTVDSWIVYNLTKGELHVTDHSNASRTALFNLSALKWDDELLKLFGIPRHALPEVLPSRGAFGICTANSRACRRSNRLRHRRFSWRVDRTRPICNRRHQSDLWNWLFAHDAYRRSCAGDMPPGQNHCVVSR